MLKYCLRKWDKNKEKLETAIRNDSTINRCDYEYLVRLIVDYILNDEENVMDIERWDNSRIICIDQGSWEGTQLYFIPTLYEAPGEDDYLLTYASYGSCEMCDMLERIRRDAAWEGLSKPPTEQQVKDYMELCRHLVCNIIKPYNKGWNYDSDFDVVDGMSLWESFYNASGIRKAERHFKNSFSDSSSILKFSKEELTETLTAELPVEYELGFG